KASFSEIASIVEMSGQFDLPVAQELIGKSDESDRTKSRAVVLRPHPLRITASVRVELHLAELDLLGTLRLGSGLAFLGEAGIVSQRFKKASARSRILGRNISGHERIHH